MSLNARQNWWIRASGLETNGGGFDPSATAGMLTDGAATVANTASPVFTSASYSFVAADVGHWLYIAAGTNWIPGYYQIASVNAGAATLSAAIGAAYVPIFGRLSLLLGCASVASPTGATFSMCYCDSDSPLLSLTTLASVASTTVTISGADAGLFTPVMVGNIIRLASAMETPTAGYYSVRTYTDSSNVVVDRASGTYTAGVAKLGGAHHHWLTYADETGGGSTGPILTTPLIAGNTINIRGSGDLDPSAADYSTGGWHSLPNGGTDAVMRFHGYNGRPGIRSSNNALVFSYTNWIEFTHVKWFIGGSSNAAEGFFYQGEHYSVIDCIADQCGYDAGGFNDIHMCVDNYFKNTGSTAAGNYYAIALARWAKQCHGNFINGWRGGGIYFWSGGNVSRNIIANCHGTACAGIYGSTQGYDMNFGSSIIGNTIYGGGDGIYMPSDGYIGCFVIRHNIVVSNTGYGLRVAGTLANNDNLMLYPRSIQFNAFYNNSSGPYSGISFTTDDILLTGNPFLDAANGDLCLNNTAGAGAACRAAAFPGAFLGGLTTGYLDIGAVQHADPEGGGSAARIFGSAIFGG